MLQFRVAFWPLVALAALGSLALISMPGTGDVEMFWLPWLDHVVRSGPFAAYGLSATDYPPLIFAVLVCVTAAANAFDLSLFLALKLSLWCCAWLTAYVFFLVTRRPYLALGLGCSLALSSTALGYLDVYTMPALVLSIWAFRHDRFTAGLLLLATSCLIKWQPLILAPAFLLYTVHRIGYGGTLRAMVPALILTGGCVVLAGSEIAEALRRAGSHPYLSALALNFHWVVSRLVELVQTGRYSPTLVLVEPAVAAMAVLKLAFVVFFLWIMVRLPTRTFEQCLEAALAGALAYFTFSPAVHENHLLNALVPAAWLASTNPKRIGDFLVVAVAANLNLLIFYGVSGQGPAIRVVLSDVAMALAFVSWVIWRLAGHSTRPEVVSAPS